MWRFVVVSFAFLGAAFYHLSGGADYQPRPGSVQVRGLSGDTGPPAPAPLPRSAKASEAGTQPPRTAVRGSDVAAPRTVLQTEGSGTAGQAAPAPDIRRVDSSVVTLRRGPGADHDRIDSLFYGTELRVLADPGTGWVRLRVIPTGQEGWLSADLLRSAD